MKDEDIARTANSSYAEKPSPTTDRDNEFVMYIIVNKDLQMSVGKLSAQVGHAVTEYMTSIARLALELGISAHDFTSAEEALRDPRFAALDDFFSWHEASQTKVTLGAHEKDMTKIASLPSVVAYVVHDEGRTEIPSGSFTAMCLAPMRRKDAPAEVRRFRLYHGPEKKEARG